MSLYVRSQPSPCLEFQAQHDRGALPVGTGSQQANPCQEGLEEGQLERDAGLVGPGMVSGVSWALLGDWNRPVASASSWPGHRSRVSAGLGWHSRGFRGWPGPSADSLTRSFFRAVTISLPVRAWWGPTASVA